MARVRGATATKELRKSAGGGKFLTLKDGDEVEGCFAGVLKHGLEGDLAEPLGVEVVWINGQNGRYSVEYDPNVHDDDDMRVSFMWNILVRGGAEDGSEDEMKIFQQGPQLGCINFNRLLWLLLNLTGFPVVMDSSIRHVQYCAGT